MDQDQMRFSTEHLWVRIDDDDRATVGVTEEAFQDLDDVTKIRLSSEGDDLIKDEAFGRLTTRSRKVMRLYAPVSGEIVEMNEDVIDYPEMILEDPFEEGWLVRVELSNMNEFDDLMTRDEYDDYLSDDTTEDDEEDLDEEEDSDDEEEDEEEEY